jgi:outer membrane protein assembly factor BamB
MNSSKEFVRQYSAILKASSRAASGFFAIGILFLFPAFQTYGQRNVNTPDFDKKPTLAWSFSCAAPIVSSPVIDAGVVYFGAEDSTWYALELTSGKLKWKIKTHAAIRSTPVVYHDRVYLMGGNGVLACADKASGKIVWRIVFDQTALFMGERSYDFADYYHSTPLIDNDILYLASGSGAMNAFQASTGAAVWRYQAGDIVHGQPVIAAGRIVFGCFDGNLYALDKASGQLSWKFKTIGHQYFPKGEVQGLLSTDGQRVFAGARDYNFYALDAVSGTAIWNIRFINGWAMSATVADTVVYIGTSDDRVMIAADTRSGRELWKTDVRFNIFGGVVLSPGNLYFGTIWGRAYALERQTGKVRWSFETPGYLENHMKYFDASDQFRPDIGSILQTPFKWIEAEHRMGGMFSTPAMSGNMMVITTAEGKVYGLKRA